MTKFESILLKVTLEALKAKKKLTKKEKAEYDRIRLALSIATILENPRKILMPL
jgi:hypothetical protein